MVPANRRWCLAAGNVTVGLASHWPHVTDISGSPPTGSRPGRGRRAPLRSLVEHGRLPLITRPEQSGNDPEGPIRSNPWQRQRGTLGPLVTNTGIVNRIKGYVWNEACIWAQLPALHGPVNENCCENYFKFIYCLLAKLTYVDIKVYLATSQFIVCCCWWKYWLVRLIQKITKK